MMSKAASAGSAAGHRSAGLAERCGLQRSAVRPRHTRHAAHLWSRLRWKHHRREGRSRFRTTATWIDLEEPTTEEEALVERCIRVDVPTEDEMAEIEPSSRLYERERRALHDGQRPSRRRGAAADDHADQLRPRRQPAGHGSLCDAQADPRVRRTTRGATRSSSATRRPRSFGCSTRSSTGSPTRSRASAGRWKSSVAADLPRAAARSGESRPTKLTALLTRIGRTQTLLTKIRYSAVSTLRMLSFLRRVEPSARGRRRRSCATMSRSLTTDVTVAERACELPVGQPHLPARRVARPDQHRAECGDEAVFLGGGRVPAADAHRRHFRNELPLHAGAQTGATAIPLSLALMLTSAVGPISISRDEAGSRA